MKILIGKRMIIVTTMSLIVALVACSQADVGGDLSSATPVAQVVVTLSNKTTTPFLPETNTPIPKPSLTPSHTPTLTLTQTSTPAPTETIDPLIRFAVIGDYGLAGQAEADVAALVLGWSPDFIITTGDNNYPVGSAETIDENIGQYFHQFIAPYVGDYGNGADINRFFPTLGNHDWITDEAQPYLDYFSLPGNERYYDFIWGPVHFFSINSDSHEPDGFRETSTQAAWLQQNLATSPTPWQIVYTHYPPYSSGPHGSTTWMQWSFKEWGVDAVLTGHDHVYERLIVDDLVYFVNGLGGGPRYLFDEPLTWSVVRFRSDYGAMLVEANRAKISFRFFTRARELIDEYLLIRR